MPKDALGHGSNPRGAREERIALNKRADQHAMMPRGQGLGVMGKQRVAAINQAVNQVGQLPLQRATAPQISDEAFNVIQQAAKAGAKEGTGFSVTPGGKQPNSGHMVSLPSRLHNIAASDLAGPHGRAHVNAFLKNHADVFRDNSNMHIGGWAHEGKIMLDPSENIRGRSEAVRAGRARNQMAIWDVKNKREIPTGGTGT